eukprot:2403911-Amphidinium_carterae.1
MPFATMPLLRTRQGFMLASRQRPSVRLLQVGCNAQELGGAFMHTCAVLWGHKAASEITTSQPIRHR